MVGITESPKFSNSYIKPQAVTNTEAKQRFYEKLHICKAWNH